MGYVKYDFKTGKFSVVKNKPKKDYAGPLWTGQLWDMPLAKDMHQVRPWREARVKTLGFYDIHALAKIYKLESLPRLDNIISDLRKKGYRAERTHFTPTAVRTNAPFGVVKKLLNSVLTNNSI